MFVKGGLVRGELVQYVNTLLGKLYTDYITRSPGLAKLILHGTVQRGRRKGRQKKRLEDAIPEWAGLGLGEALQKAEDREEWRKGVARLSLVPRRSFRLQDE